MAAIRKRGKSYEAQIRMRGVQEVKTFETLAAAREWSFIRESEIKNGQKWVARGKKLSFLLDAYAKDVTPRKKTSENERNRILRISRSWLADMKVEDIEPHYLQRWINEECLLKKTASVRRDFVVLSSALEYSKKNLRWIQFNPARDVDKPKNSPPRHRRISAEEITAITEELGYDDKRDVKTTKQQMAVAFLLAIETAMRQGEIFGLTWQNVRLDEQLVHLPDTKNGTSRDVPLSSRAIALIEKLRGLNKIKVFSAKQGSAEALFRKAVKKCELVDLRFHDSRHEATTQLAKKYENVLQLAAVTGHKDLRSLQIYYNPTATELAAMLD